jgi:hypothetical protein
LALYSPLQRIISSELKSSFRCRTTRLSLPEQPDNLTVLWEATCLFFGKHPFSVRADKKYAAGTGNEFNINFSTELLL